MADTGNAYICNACGWEYDPQQGDPDGGIAPGTLWEDIPDDWVCPVCGVGKDEFERVATGEEAPSETAEVAHVTEHGPAPLIIVGSGLAGYSLAKGLRKRDRELSITIVTADGGEVYTKPMLSNAFARHHHPDDLVQNDAVTLADELDVEIRTHTRVLSIDRDAKNLTIESTDGSEKLAYDRLVLALGADPRVFPAAGSDAVGIFTVNDLDDYRRWRERIGQSGRVLLIGAGLIGCEFANDLASAGFDVAMVDPAAWPLARLLPEELGGMLVTALQGAGCTMCMERTVARYKAAESGFLAELDDGTRIPFDYALSAVGLAPRTGLAKEVGLEVQAGIVVDQLLRTSDPAIFALGDCAQTEIGPLPFIAPLLAEAKALAATLTGDKTPLQLPAIPVVVKTPALPLVVCPPKPGIKGAWELEVGKDEAVAVFRATDGTELGFALAGSKTSQQRTLAQRMPDLLPSIVAEPVLELAEGGGTEAGDRYECDICGYVYDPKEGDTDGGVAPGTRWEDIPDDWVCPNCGAGKEEFTKVT
jgi:rubredoxin-NAD+ reductase